jgi:phospholipase C
MKKALNAGTALLSVLALLQPVIVTGAAAQTTPKVTAQPDPGPDVVPFFSTPDDGRDAQKLIPLLRDKVKYVFVIFNENHSFDNEYGTLPGVNGIYSDGRKPRSPADTPGFTQKYKDANGNDVTVEPFLIGPDQNATFVDSVDHTHRGLAKKIDVGDMRDKRGDKRYVARMDGFSADEYALAAVAGDDDGRLKGTQFARLVMSHVDCDTIPFFWQYASRFTIFDNIFATEDTPSTPNAIAMIAGQSGETQWVKHGSAGTPAPISGTVNGTAYSGMATTQGPPIVNDPQPWWGSEFDSTPANRQPAGASGNSSPNFAQSEFYGSGNIASNLTFATVPLTLMGREVTAITSRDANTAADLADILRDIPYIQNLNRAPVSWRWYQNGYDREPNDPTAAASHANYVSHHDGAQYFGYLANNPVLRDNFGGEGDFFRDIGDNKLPPGGGVIYVRGGFYNLDYPAATLPTQDRDHPAPKGLPPIQNWNYPNRHGLTPDDVRKIDLAKSGDDDHPTYSDKQLSEAMAARVINAVAAHPDIWAQSAIIITYDESDGFYDHVPPRILSYGPDGLPLSRGIRVPLILISPYARVHAVSHAEGDHNAIIETINAVFNAPALSSLPDEASALAAGNAPTFNQFGPPGFQQKYLGPRDTNSPITDSLLSGFDPKRLRGELPPLPASYAMIADDEVNTFPHYAGKGCERLHITTEDRRQGIVNNIPLDFNTLPSTLQQYNKPQSE